MNKITCFDVVSEIVSEANKRFEPIWKISAEKYDILKQYCEILDGVSSEFSGISFEVEVNEITMEIGILIECEDEIVITDNTHVFYEITKRSVQHGFSVSEEGNLLVKFVFPSVWEK